MLKENINECRIVFKIKTEGPVLIKSGEHALKNQNIESAIRRDLNIQLNQNLPHMFFVRTYRNGEYKPYIPGSSLKGVIRSHAERIVKTLHPDGCCNIFQQQGAKKDENIEPDLGCTYRFQIHKEYGGCDKIEGHKAYKNSCPVCKLFGNGFLQSRIFIPDGYADSHRMQKRDGVGIDRYSGGAAGGAKFDYEVEENATFKFSEIIIKNYDIWQLGLLGYIFQDFKDKLIKIGFGKSRGLGAVSGEIEGMKIIYYGKNKPVTNKIYGIAQFIGNSDYYTDKEKEGIKKEVDLPDSISPVTNGYKHIYSFDSTQSYHLFSKLSETFSNEGDSGYINGNVYVVPDDVKKENLESIKREAIEPMSDKEEAVNE